VRRAFARAERIGGAVSLARALADVDAVLAHGASKHGDLEAGRRVHVAHHLDKARSHLDRAGDGSALDPETGLPHVAHACARLLLALASDSVGACVPCARPAEPCYVLSDSSDVHHG
jgi:hypothetical protein